MTNIDMVLYDIWYSIIMPIEDGPSKIDMLIGRSFH